MNATCGTGVEIRALRKLRREQEAGGRVVLISERGAPLTATHPEFQQSSAFAAQHRYQIVKTLTPRLIRRSHGHGASNAG
jgi:hypothetical protein